MLNKVTFGGFNYIHYKTADKNQVQADAKKLKDFVKKNKLEKFAFAEVCQDGKTIGVLTKSGNPDLDISLLMLISDDLVKEYIKETRVDLFV